MISRCGVKCAAVQACTKCLPRTHGAVGETPTILSISACLEGRKSWNLRTKYHRVAFLPVQHKFWLLKNQAYLPRRSVLSCKLLSVWLILFESTEPSSRRSSLWEVLERNGEIVALCQTLVSESQHPSVFGVTHWTPIMNEITLSP